MTSLLGAFGQSLAGRQQQQQQQQGVGTGTEPAQPNQPGQAMGSSLPQSGVMQQVAQWQQQMSALEERYKKVTGGAYKNPAATAQLPGVPPLQQASMQGASGVAGLGNQLAERYGVAGRAPLIDPAGNFTRMPNGADEAAKFQFISQALANLRSEQQQKAAQSSIETGIGLVKSRGRGSLAVMQSGMYQSLAQVQQADIQRIQESQPNFGYFIEKEMQDRQEKLQRDIMRHQKKQAKYSMVGSILGGIAGFAIGGGGMKGLTGAAIGSQLGQGAGQGASYY